MIGVAGLAGWIRRRRALRRRFNPYVVGTPVFDRALFFGREALIRRTLGLLERRHVSLTDERRIGKTSLLHQLRAALAGRDDGVHETVPVFVDFESLPDAGLLESLVEETVEVLAPLVPDRGERKRGTERGDAAGRFRRYEGLLEEFVCWKRRPLRLVYLIDEIEVLGDSASPCRTLAALGVGGRAQVRFVVASARRWAEAQRGREPEWEMFEQSELPPLSAQAGEALVRDPVRGVFDYEAAAVSTILERSELRPYRIQKLCARAVDHMLDEGRSVIRQGDVDAADRWRADAPAGEAFSDA